MMDFVYKRILAIEKDPVIFIGKKSLVLLKAYIMGYIYREREYRTNCMYLSYIEEFSTYIKKYYKVSEDVEWDRVIVAYTRSEESAFEMFYYHLDEYVKSLSKIRY